MTSTDIRRAWRALRTGLAFAAFGAGALVLAFCVFPLLRLIPGDRRRREFRMQYLVHLAFRCFVTIMTGLATIGSSRCRSSTASRCGPAGRRTSRSGSMGASISRPWSRPGAARSCSAPMWGASTSCAGALLAEGTLNAFLSRPPDDAPGGSDP